MFIPMNKKTNFRFLAPFEDLNLDKEYMVVKKQRLDNIPINQNIYQNIYDPVGLTQFTYDEDYRSGVEIITLSNDSEELLVPSRYLSFSDKDMITYKYSRRVLIMDIGAIESNESLEQVKLELKATTIDKLGIDPNIREEVVSDITFIKDSIHNSLKNARLLSKGSFNNDKDRIRRLEVILQERDNQIENLKCIIKTLEMP